MATALPASEASDGRASAQRVGLRYSTDRRSGITRRRTSHGFVYRRPDDTSVRDTATLTRIRALAIPPAWTDVWICPDPSGHLQATGRDARGRKQSRYHARFRADRDEAKFARLIAFAHVLPRIRERCDADLARPGLAREKVLAAVVRLLEATLIRVGNDEYARLNRSFGLTTLRNRHAVVTGTQIRFRFRGKAGRQHEVGLRDRRLAGVIRRCQELPGQELFQYVGEDGERLRPGGSENGFWRPGPAPRDVEALITHNTGFLELSLGEVVFNKLEMVSDLLARTSTAREVAGLKRLYGLVEGDLAYAVDMAAEGKSLQAHISARLQLLPD